MTCGWSRPVRSADSSRGQCPCAHHVKQNCNLPHVPRPPAQVLGPQPVAAQGAGRAPCSSHPPLPRRLHSLLHSPRKVHVLRGDVLIARSLLPNPSTPPPSIRFVRGGWLHPAAVLPPHLRTVPADWRVLAPQHWLTVPRHLIRGTRHEGDGGAQTSGGRFFQPVAESSLNARAAMP